jgi:hypothetical protein
MTQVRYCPPTKLPWKRIGEDIDGMGSGEGMGESVSLSYDGNVLAIGGVGYMRLFHYEEAGNG